MNRNRVGLMLAIAALGLAAAPYASRAQNAADQAREEIESTLGRVPAFVNTVPDEGLPGAWEELRDLELSETALPGKIKSLIGLAVAAQIPCAYCVYFDTEGAKQAGATEQEIREALTMAAITRHWSTVLNGSQMSMDKFQTEVQAMMDHAQSSAAKAPGTARPVVDAKSAYADIEQTLGVIPTFFRVFPPVAIAGAWKEFKGVQLNPATALSGKYKELIGLAVAAQIPCSYCITAHSTFAKANGATEAELQEAIAISALSRHWSTLINGSQIDMAKFKKETDAMLKYTSKPAKNASR